MLRPPELPRGAARASAPEEFQLADALIAVGYLHRPRVLTAGKDDPDWLPMLWLGQTVQTLRGVVWACEGGYSRAADAQVRSLFEDLLGVHWMIAHPAEACTRHDEHFRHTQMRHHDRLDMHESDLERPRIPDLTDEQRNGLETRFGAPASSYQRAWHGLKDQALLDQALARIEDDAEKVRYRQFADLVRGGLHLRVHSSPAGLNAMIFEGPAALAGGASGDIVGYMGPSCALVWASLSNANWVARRLLALLFEALGLEDARTFEAVVERYRRQLLE
jgi:hypothetical protein